MYKFVESSPTKEEGGSPFLMSIQTIFDGKNLDKILNNENGEFQTLQVNGRSDLSYNIFTDEIPSRDGVYEGNKRIEPKEIEVKYKIKGYSNNKFRKQMNLLNSLIQGSKKTLQFTDEMDMTFYATLLSNELEEEQTNDLEGVLTFLCSNPIKYGDMKKTISLKRYRWIDYAGMTWGDLINGN